MENRETEITRLTASFLSEMMALVGRYRQFEPSDRDVIGQFEKKVDAELGRYDRKFESLLVSDPRLADLIKETQALVHQIAGTELARCREEGKVEFDSLIGELYRNRAELEKVIARMGGK
jgi:hypothetical protein